LTDDAPVSWLLIEHGWKVLGSDGTEIGRVDEVIGDSGKDIFDGLSVSSGVFGRSRYVAAERVRSIYEGRVEVDVSADEAERLEIYDEPAASEEILPVTASRWQRFLGRIRG